MIDKRDKLKNQAPFSCKLTKDGKAFIYYNAKLVYSASGKDYADLRNALEKNDDFLLQQIMAKMTRNFKRGNERSNRR